MRNNLILSTDSYKASHFDQYPAGATRVNSYIESRGGPFEETVFFGLQAFIRQYLLTPITQEDVDEAASLFKAHGVPFNKEGWQRIVDVHGGYLPLMIDAVPEGTVMRPGNVQVQVQNTDPELPWLTSYVETMLLRAVWYPSTVATISREVKKIIMRGLVETSDDPTGQIPVKLHDFGARGSKSAEAAALGGMAHLVNFIGTDTVEALVAARRYYDEPMAGISIPATEHSTVTTWGEDGELEMFRNLLKNNPTGYVACVSDSYDVFRAVTEYWGKELREEVLARDGVLVIRPDSGDPVETPLKVIELAMDAFGSTVNGKGYRVLPDQVRVIQGDGMTPETIGLLVDRLIEKKISVDNIAFGMGGGLLDKGIDRDTLKYAMKASAVEIDEEWKDVFKDPITDSGKRSKRGLLSLVDQDGELVTISHEIADETGQHDYLRGVYINGTAILPETLEKVRERAAI